MMPHTSLICFLASYLVAFALEIVRFRRTNRWARWGGVGFRLGRAAGPDLVSAESGSPGQLTTPLGFDP